MKLLLLAILTLLIVATVAACGGLTFAIANAPAHFGDFDRRADVPYGSLERQRLDVYTPDHARDAPIVVFWHGGGWTSDNKNQYRFVGATLAGAGYIAVVPNYRLYPDVKFPAFVDDAELAFDWVVKHAAAIGGDPRRIFVAGHSAGAHLAAMVAYDEARREKAGIPAGSIRGFIGLSGPYALVPNDDELNRMFAAPYTAADWQPAQLVRPGAPPALLIHGEADDVVAVGHAKKMAAALEKAGVPVTLTIYPKRKHSDTIAAFARAAPHKLPVMEQIRTFIVAQSRR